MTATAHMASGAEVTLRKGRQKARSTIALLAACCLSAGASEPAAGASGAIWQWAPSPLHSADVEPAGMHGDAALAWLVYADGRLVLTVTDRPGPLISTAAPPPDRQPVLHPFLSATAHYAAEEERLRSILEQTTDISDFLARLRREGYTVEAAGRR